jgi:hypothetical protein
MKKIFFGILASMLITSGVYAGKGKKDRTKKASKAQTCNPANCDKTKCQPANCVSMACCK